MKRILAIFLSMLMILCLAGCGSKTEPASPAQETQDAANTSPAGPGGNPPDGTPPAGGPGGP
ncbi:MAG: hypothetical protein II155_07410, partial [Clostridia bacterium]|nr:hypothetical protein [Clostridia bacterium]